MSDNEEDVVVPTGENEKEVGRLWRAWRTVKQMCQDRGYELDDEEVNISLDTFKREFTSNGAPDRSRMRFPATPSSEMLKKHTPLPTAAKPDPEPTCGSVWVEFSNDTQQGIKQLRAFAQYIQGNNYKTGIYITQTPLTSAAVKILPVVHPSVIEPFQESELLVNITHHELVPKHILLSAGEKKDLLERYRLKESQLPRIQVGDPVAKYLGLKRGHVVKIIRRSETAGRYASYRWVI